MEITITYGPDYHSLKDWVMTESKPFNRIYIPMSGEAVYHSAETSAHIVPGYLYVLPSHTFYQVESERFNVIFVDVLVTPMLANKLVGVRLSDFPILSGVASVLHQLLLENSMTEPLKVPLVRFLLEYLYTRGLVTPADDSVLNAAIRIIHQHQGIGITVDGLAEHCGMNRVSFTQKFSRTFGVPPQHYILRVRMQHAMALLAEGRSVADTSQATGYDDAKSFTRAFKKYCSISPRAYRSSVRPHSETYVNPPFLPPLPRG